MKIKTFFAAFLLTAAATFYNSNAHAQVAFAAVKSTGSVTDSIQILHNRNKEIKLTPNPIQPKSINLSCNSNELMHFYLFDVEGTLLYRFLLQGNDEKQLTQLHKGIYTYDIFKQDVSIEQGKIIIN